MKELAEETLPGGWGHDVRPVRIGGAVHRAMNNNSKFVHDTLVHLQKNGFGWAPRFRGMDDQGREILEYVDGYTPHGQEVPNETWSLATMTEIFRQIRRLHDMTTGTDLAGDEECVCHGDLSYANTVYRDGKAVAFIDWDRAHPGRRVEDVAYAIMEYLSLGQDIGAADAKERAHLSRVLADAYGLTPAQRAITTETMLGLLLKTHAGQSEEIKKGTVSGRRLAEAGVPELMLRRYRWLGNNKAVFEAAFV